MTDRQREVLTFISKFRAEYGYSPTAREIAAHFRWTSSHSATTHIVALEKKGMVKVTPRVARSTVITPRGRRALR